MMKTKVQKAGLEALTCASWCSKVDSGLTWRCNRGLGIWGGQAARPGCICWADMPRYICWAAAAIPKITQTAFRASQAASLSSLC